MPPPDHAKDKKPKKPNKPKPHALQTIEIADLPPASSYSGELVAVEDSFGEVVYLAYSNGVAWLSVAIVGQLVPPPPLPPDDGDSPETD